MSLMDKYKSKISREEQKKMDEAVNEAKSNQRTYKEVPPGSYVVNVAKMEVSEAPWGDDQLSIHFEVMAGEYEGQKIFYNGRFDENFAVGLIPTSIMLETMLCDGTSAGDIAVILGKEKLREKFIEDVYDSMDGLEFDLEYEIRKSKKTNPNTGQPYENKFYTITDVYES